MMKVFDILPILKEDDWKPFKNAEEAVKYVDRCNEAVTIYSENSADTSLRTSLGLKGDAQNSVYSNAVEALKKLNQLFVSKGEKPFADIDLTDEGAVKKFIRDYVMYIFENRIK